MVDILYVLNYPVSLLKYYYQTTLGQFGPHGNPFRVTKFQ
jgi:hypothetical protein